MSSSFVRRDFFEVVGTGMATLGNKVVDSCRALCAGRKVAPAPSPPGIAELVEENFSEISPIIAGYISQDVADDGRCTNETFSHFFGNSKLKLKFLSGTKNVVELFQRFQWDINKMSSEWKQALEKAQKTRKNGEDIDVLTIANVRLTQEQLKVIACHIPNVKKLDVSSSFVDKEIVALSQTLFPKLREITYTNVLETTDELREDLITFVHGIQPSGSMGNEGYYRDMGVMYTKKSSLEPFRHTLERGDKISMPLELRGGRLEQLIIDDAVGKPIFRETFGAVVNTIRVRYRHLPATATLKIEPK